MAAHLGNRFELEIGPVGRSHIGWYRCATSTPHEVALANLYFIDVISDADPIVVPSVFLFLSKYGDVQRVQGVREQKVPQMQRQFPPYLVESFARMSNFTRCNQCGHNAIGEMRRRIACYLRV